MSTFVFSVSEKEGIIFSKFSGDNNSIHLNNRSGYNSIYGYKIVHGALILIKFFEIINYPAEYSQIQIQFKIGFRYNIPIQINSIKKNKNINTFKVIQKNGGEAIISIYFFKNNILFNEFKGVIFKKSYFLSKSKQKKFKNIYTPTDFKASICYLSKYVGTDYPNVQLLISKIIISKNFIQKHNNILIQSLRKDLRLPLIKNQLRYNKYDIYFDTLIRPDLNVKFQNPNSNILKKINSITKNILIIGASSGIGHDLLKLFINNDKIKIIATYFINKIKIKNNNLIIKKIDINCDLKSIKKIIQSYKPILIYYFATPKIIVNTKNKEIIKLFKKYYIEYPLKIIKIANVNNCNFFYPSSSYINDSELTSYSIIKLEAENKIMKLKNMKIQINILRIPEINTKQNLSLLYKNLPNFRDLLFKSKKIQKKVFFND